MTSSGVVAEIKSKLSVLEVVGETVQLKRAGSAYKGLCPFHAEKTPSFNVREETGRYRCFGCDQAGDVFTFVQQTRHTDFVGAVEHLAGKTGMQLTYTNASQSAERWVRSMDAPSGDSGSARASARRSA